MKELLTEFENCLLSHKVQAINLLQPGSLKNKVLEDLKNIEIENPELVDFYCWRNGVSDFDMQNKNISELELFPFGIMLSLESAINIYLLYTTKLKAWSKSLFPIFANGGGDFLLLDIDNNSKQFSQIHIYCPSILLSTQTETIYDSIETLFKTVIACYYKGVYKMDNDDISIDVDYYQEKELSKSLNPNSDYWME